MGRRHKVATSLASAMLKGDEITALISRHRRISASPSDSRFSETQKAKQRIENATQISPLQNTAKPNLLTFPHLLFDSGDSRYPRCALLVVHVLYAVYWNNINLL